MKKLHAGIGLILAACVVLTLSAQDAPRVPNAPGAAEQPAIVVGTFDSRAIAMAYVGSEQFKEYLGAQRADIMKALERAKAAGDEDLVAGLDALGPAMQRRIHRQGFGTAPVDDIIARIEDRLPAIAQEAGVDVIVSRWALTYQSPDAQFVDVTDRLVAVFNPDEKTLKSIRQIVQTEPVPLDQLQDIDH